MESSSVTSPTLFIFLKAVLAILVPLPFCMNFRKACLYLRKRLLQFYWDSVESVGENGENEHINDTEFSN